VVTSMVTGTRPLLVRVRCDCGRTSRTRAIYLKNGHTRSCGCLQREVRHAPRPRVVVAAGERFGRLTVVSVVQTHKRSSLLMHCDCGRQITMNASNVRRGLSTSCGCWKREFASLAATDHGWSHTPAHRAWLSAKGRCYNPANPAYDRYGGRGIVMCDRWRDSFDHFLADMGDRPSPQHSLDRRDNDGPYAPDNCRWATAKEQANNRRVARPRRKE